MDDGQVDWIRRALRRRSKPPWRVIWRVGPPELWDTARSTRHGGGYGQGSCVWAGGCCGSSGYVMTSTWCPGLWRVGVAATAMPSSSPMTWLEVPSAMTTLNSPSARSVAEPSSGPMVGPHFRVADRSRGLQPFTVGWWTQQLWRREYVSRIRKYRSYLWTLRQHVRINRIYPLF
jgi:hypothetical protein